MRNRITKGVAVIAILCALVTVFAVPMACAASYSKVYGQTQDRLRVRASASSSATVIDNIVKGACVYVTSSTTSGSSTFIKVKYRNSDGEEDTGWLCQSDGKTTYVKILSATAAQDTFKVSGGNLPSTRVGTFSASERKAAQGSTSGSSASSSPTQAYTDSTTVKSAQTMLKALGYYSGSITGNIGEKTETAIRRFQKEFDLSVDGIPGPQTMAKLESVYKSGSASTSSSSGSSGLKLGSSGAAVRDLQTDLTTLGYYWADITGSFGAKTEAAVKLFQEKNNLTVDGVAGTKTLAAIASAIARKGATSSASSSASGVLKLDSQGSNVATLQENLKQLGYYYASITGNFGSKTEAAVKLFQEKNGLTADGVAGAKTLAAIASAVEKAGGSTSSSSSSAQGLKLGSTGAQVSALQTDLTTLGYYYADITGHYGSLTQSAVKKFQKARGLTDDGVAGTKTLEAIASALKSTGSTSASSSTSAGGSLREGDTGAAVKELQTMLNQLEYYYGDITGHYGSLTKKAVRAFQDDNGLTVDGVAGVNTINKLRSLTGSTGSSGSSGGTTVTTANSYGRITKDNVYLRASYSTTSASKASLSKGTKCRITKTYNVGEYKWYYITVVVGRYTYRGYVRSDMIETISAEEYGSGADDSSSDDLEVLGMIRITGDNVALRTSPSTSAEKAGEADTGDVFYYIDTEDGWFRTKSGYWISKSYAKVMDEDEVNEYVNGSGSSSGSSSGGTSYKFGDTGSTVGYIQTALKKLGYYSGSITNHYGSLTKQAVMDFQGDNGLSRDGVVGTKTMNAITAAYNGATSGSGNTGVVLNEIVYDLNWYTYKSVYNAVGIARGKTFTLTDLKTGKSFKVYVQSTGQHADVEPATAADTAIMCSIYGVSSPDKISYVRRAMIATVGSYQFACSMYGEPHGAEVITNNNFDGQFCVHFRGSKTSETLLVREENQTPIDQAVAYVKSKGKTVETTLTLK